MLRLLPNFVTIMRIMSAPVVVFLLLDELLIIAFWVIVFSGLSDYFDGYLAKRLSAVTLLGTILDPLADKVFLVSVFISLTIMGLLPAWIVCLVIMRDILILGGVFLSRLVDLKLKIEPIWMSKLNTFLQMGLGLIVLAGVIVGANTPYLAVLMVHLVSLTTIISGTVYLMRWTEGCATESDQRFVERIE